MTRDSHSGVHHPSRGLVTLAIVLYAAVILALTTLKAFYRIGYLWKPENQRVQELMLVPFTMLRRSHSWFAPLFDYVGNIAFFIPLGMLLFVALHDQRVRKGDDPSDASLYQLSAATGASQQSTRELAYYSNREPNRKAAHQPTRRAARRAIVRATLIALVFSIGVEVAQFVFTLGRTSTDDIWCNALGAFLGASFARLCGPRFHRVWVYLPIVLATVFAVLVGLGDRLGDPTQVVEV